MKNKFKIGDPVICDEKNCHVIDLTWSEHMDEFIYLVWWNEEYATVLERDLKINDQN
ncbi:MAG: hypothetical protein M0R03_16960 [Novosphingobium sp.]|nr:hypothetical protein [Novosphingobium sp.]